MYRSFREEVNIMKTRRIFCLLLSSLLAAGSLVLPIGAVMASESTSEAAITRVTVQFEATIPANTIAHLGDSFSMNSGDIVSYDCTYTPRNASVKFGYIAPDGLFYGVEGSRGSFGRSIRVGQRGTYTLAIWNKSDNTLTMEGTVSAFLHDKRSAGAEAGYWIGACQSFADRSAGYINQDLAPAGWNEIGTSGNHSGFYCGADTIKARSGY